MNNKRIHIFTGHFGSGKTEAAINYAIKLNASGKKTCIADLDIVNPYFSVRDVKDYLEELGIKVIAPSIEITTAELSTVPSDLLFVFHNKDYEIVLDIGGDDYGAVVLGQYNRFFNNDYDMFFVINTNRPFTKDKEGIIEYIDTIERASRLKVSYFINNTNMCSETNINHIIEGQKVIEEASKLKNIEIKYTCVTENLEKELPLGIKGEIMKIKLFMRPEWLK